jgi:drug/metabolite transporter (DMT)-like permease
MAQVQEVGLPVRDRLIYHGGMQGSQAASRRGIAAMMIAMAAFVVQDTFVKLAAVNWPTAQVLVVRGSFACCFAFALLTAMGYGRQLGLLASRPVLIRSVIESALAICFVSALAALPIAEITAILLVSPLLITAGSAFVLRDRVGWRRWLAVGLGMAGMLLVVRPTGEGAGVATWLAVASAVLVAVRDLYTRMIGVDVPSPVLAQGAALGTVAGGLLLSLATPWAPFDLRAFVYLAIAAVFVVAGNYTVIVAFRNGDTSLVSPFRFSVIVWAAIAGYAVFGEVPDVPATLGIALIIGSGIYTLHRERVRAAAAATRGNAAT